MFPFFRLSVGHFVINKFNDGRFYAGVDTQFAGTQLEYVDSKIQAAFERDDTFYSRIDKGGKEVEVSNRDARFPIELRPGGKFGHYDPEGGDLGLGETPTMDKAVIGCVHLKFAVQINLKPAMGTDTRRKAVLDAVKHSTAKAMPEFRAYMDRMCMTSGNGVLGTISNVVNGGGNDTYTFNTTGDGFGNRLLRFGQNIKVYDTTLATDRTAAGERAITSIDYEAKTIVVPQVVGAVATDKVLVSGVSGASPVSFLGVPYHHTNASTGTWLGFTRSSTPEVRANRVNANSTSFALPFARLAVNKIRLRVGINTPLNLKAWLNPAQTQSVEELAQLIQTIERTGGSDAKAGLYFKKPFDLAGAMTEESGNWDKTRIDFIDEKLWVRPEVKKPGILEIGGRRIFELRGSTGGVAASQIFYLTVGTNLGHRNPAMGAYIDALTVPSGY